MRNDEFMNFGEEISQSLRRVLNSNEIGDLKRMINDTVQAIPGMGGTRIFRDETPYWEDGIRLYKEEPTTRSRENASDQSREHTASQSRGDAASQRQKSKKPGRSREKLGTVLFVLGLVGLVPSAVLCLLAVVAILIGGDAWGLLQLGAAFGGLLTAGFASLSVAGRRMKKNWGRLRLYQRVIGKRSLCQVEELAAVTEKSPKFIVRDLKAMVKKGMFAEGYLDAQESCFMLDYQTYCLYLESVENTKRRKLEEERQRQQEQEKWAAHPDGEVLRQTIQEGKDYVKKIKEVNDLLPEEEISQKLDQLEQVTTSIFSYVEQHPEKLPEIRRLMCYYMPITLKLVDAYQKFEQNGGWQPEAVAAKKEIKGTLDTINRAYGNLLQKLMQADYWDISSDISALETILAQEGLTK